jgi:hypothetical protein
MNKRLSKLAAMHPRESSSSSANLPGPHFGLGASPTNWPAEQQQAALENSLVSFFAV